MKKSFREYYPLGPRQLNELFSRASIVPDTNVLLDQYRSSENAADELFAVLEAAKNQLWMPYRVGFEYHERVNAVIADIRRKHRNSAEILDGGLDKLRAAFGDFRHPFVREYVLGAIDSLGQQLKEELRKPEWSIEKLDHRMDRVRSRIERLFDESRIGKKQSSEKLTELLKEGERRYKEEIPPGFKDSGKTAAGGRQYGDLIIWKELIARAKDTNAPILFITRDLKEDWWLRVDGETKGPLPALRAEMLSEAQQDFHLYTSERFLEFAAPVFLKRSADAAALEEAERAARAGQLSALELTFSQNLRNAQSLFDRGSQSDVNSSSLEMALQRIASQDVFQSDFAKALLARYPNLGEPALAAVVHDLSPLARQDEILAGTALGMPASSSLSAAILESARNRVQSVNREQPPVSQEAQKSKGKRQK